jgi:hypothetical protein
LVRLCRCLLSIAVPLSGVRDMPNSRNHPDPREMLLDALLDKVWDDRYPSNTMLDLIESLLRDDEVVIYTRVLLRKVRHERFPSIPMLRRIAALCE